MTPRLTTEMLGRASILAAERRGIYASILRHGDNRAGALFVELDVAPGQAALLVRRTNFEGCYEWDRLTGEGLVSAQDVSERLAREVERDPDCWVISVQDNQGRNIFLLDETSDV